MAANIRLSCPQCGKPFSLRYDPGTEDAAPRFALQQLEAEHPDHTGPWRFWPKMTDSPAPTPPEGT